MTLPREIDGRSIRSNMVSLRLDVDMLRALRLRADADKVTISEYIRRLLASDLSRPRHRAVDFREYGPQPYTTSSSDVKIVLLPSAGQRVSANRTVELPRKKRRIAIRKSTR